MPHCVARPGQGYVIRVSNASTRHIACAVFVDGENALLKDGSLIVAPGDRRELQGFLVSKNFIGKEYVKEYRDFIFGKPKVIEATASSSSSSVDTNAYTSYGRIVCDIYEAVLDEEVDSDTELRGQTTFYRGAGANGSYDERLVPEGKKKHFIYSAVTVQGARSAIANSTRGRWWVRGQRLIRSIELRYREPHALMLLGVKAGSLGLACKEEALAMKDEKFDFGFGKKEEEPDLDGEKAKLAPGVVETCDLTLDDDPACAIWTAATTDDQAPAAVELDAEYPDNKAVS